MILNMPKAAPLAQETIADRYMPSAWESFTTGVDEGFDWTTTQALKSLAQSGVRWGAPLTEDEWKKSEWFRDGLSYEPSMTVSRAESLAERQDERRLRSFLTDRMGWGATLARVAGDFIGSIPDPLNFVPFVGVAGKVGTRAVRVAGRTGGRALVGAGDAAIGVGLLQPLLAVEHASYQDKYDLTMAMTNVAFATVIGGGFGAIAGRLSRATPEERIHATSKAVADAINERVTDVKPVIPSRRPVTAAVRQWLDSAPPEPPPSRRSPEAIVSQSLSGTRGEPAAEIAQAISVPGADRTPLGSAIADQYSGDIATLADAVSTPNFRRTPAQKALLDALDLSFADERALRIWSQPVAERAADDATFLAAYREGRVDELLAERPRALLAQAEELDKQIADTQKQIEEAESGLRAADPANEARVERLVEARDALQADAARLQSDAESLAPGQQIDWSAPPERAGPGFTEPLVEETPILRQEELGTLDETDVALIDARFADLETAGELPSVASRLLDGAAQEGERFSRMARAVEQGLSCLLRG